ncbi:MAG: MarR family winged helix-turn-helix transcriptional regulator [Candidatus Hodarchaeales archaeon]
MKIKSYCLLLFSVFLFSVVPYLPSDRFSLQQTTIPVEFNNKINAVDSIDPNYTRNGYREVLTGDRITNVTIHVSCAYSQLVGNASVEFYFSSTPQVNGSYQIEDQDDGRYITLDKSFMKLGNPINPGTSFTGRMLTVPELTTERVYVDVVTGPDLQDGLPGDVGISVQFELELDNGSSLLLRRFGAAFGGFFSIDQGAAGPFIQLEYNLTDMEYPHIHSLDILPGNPTTDYDVVIIKFWASDNLGLNKIYVRYEVEGHNTTQEIYTKEFKLGPPFFSVIGSFPVGTVRVWVIISDVSAWNNGIITEPISITIEAAPDVLSPVISSSNYSFYSNDPSAEITWFCQDDNPGLLEIYVNDKLVLRDEWENGEYKLPMATIGWRNVSLGLNNVTAVFYDINGLYYTSQIWITIREPPLNLPVTGLIGILILSILLPASFIIYKRFFSQPVIPAMENLVILYVILKQVMSRYRGLINSGSAQLLLSGGPTDGGSSKDSGEQLVPLYDGDIAPFRLKIANLFKLPPEELIQDIKSLNLDRVTDKGLKELIYLASRWPEHVIQAEISTHLDIRKSTVQNTTRVLIEKGLIESNPAITDTRKIYLRISEQGISLLEKLTAQLEVVLSQNGLI